MKMYARVDDYLRLNCGASIWQRKMQRCSLVFLFDFVYKLNDAICTLIYFAKVIFGVK